MQPDQVDWTKVKTLLTVAALIELNLVLVLASLVLASLAWHLGTIR